MHAAAAAKSITLDAHQLHGGMGYVVETDLHLFSERARVLSTLGGGADVAATWLEGEEKAMSEQSLIDAESACAGRHRRRHRDAVR